MRLRRTSLPRAHPAVRHVTRRPDGFSADRSAVRTDPARRFTHPVRLPGAPSDYRLETPPRRRPGRTETSFLVLCRTGNVPGFVNKRCTSLTVYSRANCTTPPLPFIFSSTHRRRRGRPFCSESFAAVAEMTTIIYTIRTSWRFEKQSNFLFTRPFCLTRRHWNAFDTPRRTPTEKDWHLLGTEIPLFIYLLKWTPKSARVRKRYNYNK